MNTYNKMFVKGPEGSFVNFELVEEKVMIELREQYMEVVDSFINGQYKQMMTQIEEYFFTKEVNNDHVTVGTLNNSMPEFLHFVKNTHGMDMCYYISSTYWKLKRQ